MMPSQIKELMIASIFLSIASLHENGVISARGFEIFFIEINSLPSQV